MKQLAPRLADNPIDIQQLQHLVFTYRANELPVEVTTIDEYTPGVALRFGNAVYHIPLPARHILEAPQSKKEDQHGG